MCCRLVNEKHIEAYRIERTACNAVGQVDGAQNAADDSSTAHVKRPQKNSYSRNLVLSSTLIESLRLKDHVDSIHVKIDKEIVSRGQ